MMHLSQLLVRQSAFILKHRWHALLHAVILALLPYTTWLSVALIALVTLRKGWHAGCWLLLPVMMASLTLSLFSISPFIAVVEMLLTFLPCYIAACVLRYTASWQAVAWVFILQVMVVVGVLQLVFPELILAQYFFVEQALQGMKSNGIFLAFMDARAVNQTIFASYLLGLQAVGIVFSACLSLFLARSVQSRLFNPNGFKQEILRFRGTKIGLGLLGLLVLAAAKPSLLAISLLPILVFYFLLAGFSLSFYVFRQQWRLVSFVLLVVAFFVLPFVMLPVYVIFGFLDSLFNFRLYLPTKVGKTT